MDIRQIEVHAQQVQLQPTRIRAVRVHGRGGIAEGAKLHSRGRHSTRAAAVCHQQQQCTPFSAVCLSSSPASGFIHWPHRHAPLLCFDTLTAICCQHTSNQLSPRASAPPSPQAHTWICQQVVSSWCLCNLACYTLQHAHCLAGWHAAAALVVHLKHTPDF